MAPESPDKLVVLDFREGSRGFDCTVDRWDPERAEGSLRVTWAASTTPGGGYMQAGGGVVWVAAPPGYAYNRYEAESRTSADPLRLTWSDTVAGSYLMLVATLPPGYVFAEMAGSGPLPDEAKVFAGRMALFWALTARSGPRVRVSWRLEPLSGRDLEELCWRLNDTSANSLSRLPDLGEADLADRLRWQSSAPVPQHVVPVDVALNPDLYRTYALRADNVTVSGPTVVVADQTGSPQVTINVASEQANYHFETADLRVLKRELDELDRSLRLLVSTPEQREAAEAVTAAIQAASKGDRARLRSSLAAAGRWALDVARSISTDVAAAAIKSALGLS